jgi:hypothetical protein
MEWLMGGGESDRANVKAAWVDVSFLELPMFKMLGRIPKITTLK